MPTQEIEMIDDTIEDQNESPIAQLPPTLKRSSVTDDPVLYESPSLLNASNHVVIVMDALEEFSNEPLQWALDNVIGSGYRLTLLGVMPWLNIPHLSILKERSDWKSDKYQKVRAIVELCEKYGVVPYMKVAQGNPLRLVVVEQTTNLHAKWVVFDRHHRKNRSYYARTIPCNIVMMNSDGEVEMLRTRSMIDDAINTPGGSPSSLPPVPEVIYSKKFKELLKVIKAR